MYDFAFRELSFTQKFGILSVIFSVMAFLAILFLQSGLDKIIDRKGNMEWLKGHFANSPLAGTVPVLLTVITVMEMLTGVLSLASAALLFFVKFPHFPLPFYAAASATATLLMLFFGQRMAKDYTGAAGIVPYFIVAILTMLLTFVLS